ncbi:protein of unknown function (plasmid) [Cupriavidus taiwanensis]|uniref:Uncharacterized protein n=1 Tax=Cupriavidus taiwanensis TaxID=164546 RepID=A0A375IMX3_9BURK|nr:protein of unknown function [Cupriavidus taiwanensis]
MTQFHGVFDGIAPSNRSGDRSVAGRRTVRHAAQW